MRRSDATVALPAQDASLGTPQAQVWQECWGCVEAGEGIRSMGGEVWAYVLEHGVDVLGRLLPDVHLDSTVGGLGGRDIRRVHPTRALGLGEGRLAAGDRDPAIRGHASLRDLPPLE